MLKLLIMKKRIIIGVTCMAVAVIYVDAQNKSTIISTRPTVTESYVTPAPPPPPPPAPPIPPVPPSSSMDEIEFSLPPVPPVPPTTVLTIDDGEINGPEIINNNGNEISIRTINGKTMVVVKKDGKTQNIKLSTWNANRKYYEKKYGQLPPPPPPPEPVIEEVEFITPVIKKDN